MKDASAAPRSAEGDGAPLDITDRAHAHAPPEDPPEDGPPEPCGDSPEFRVPRIPGTKRWERIAAVFVRPERVGCAGSARRVGVCVGFRVVWVWCGGAA